MPRPSPARTVRILIVGNEGVGKNCLESRFTTCTYPPPYDPALTLTSRRTIALASSPPLSSPLSPASPTGPYGHQRFPSQLSVLSDQQRSDWSSPAGSPSSSEPSSPATSLGSFSSDLSSSFLSSSCAACASARTTYMVEVINHPSLRSARERRQLHARRAYDAVLIVYDVTDRDSFDAVVALYDELSPPPPRPYEPARLQKRRPEGDDDGLAVWPSEPVVVIVGNKADVDELPPAVPGRAVDERDELEREIEWLSTAAALSREDPSCPRLDVDLGLGIGNWWKEDCARRWPSAPTSVSTMTAVERAPAPAPARPACRSYADPRTLTSRFSSWSATSEEAAAVVDRWPAPRFTGRPSPHIPAAWQEILTLENEEAHMSPPSPPPEPPVRDRSHPVREVPRYEGEALALLLGVPFFEASARTGDRVEAIFEAMVHDAARRGEGGETRSSCRAHCAVPSSGRVGAKAGGRREASVDIPMRDLAPRSLGFVSSETVVENGGLRGMGAGWEVPEGNGLPTPVSAKRHERNDSMVSRVMNMMLAKT